MQGVVDEDIARAFEALPETLTLNAEGYDPWGFQPAQARFYYSIAKRIYSYFRPEITGIENIPKGRVLIVPNHSGQLPLDGLVIAVACLLKKSPPRLVRAMVERWVPSLPWVNVAFSRAGVVLGDPINCRNLLEADNAILVFPEGARGSGKTFDQRYQLARFGRGFVRLALQTNSPIVPCGVVGAEESIISLADIKPLAKLFKMPYFPISPHYFPLPVKFHVRFGEPIHLEGRFDDEDEVIDQKVDVVMQAVRELIKTGLAERKGWFE